MGQPFDDNLERYFAKTLKSCATFLARWKGAQVETSAVPWPPAGMRIVLTADGVNGNLVLICHGPLSASVPPRWTNADITVHRNRLPEALQEEYQRQDGFRVTDQIAGLDLITPQIGVYENVKLKSVR